MTITFAHNLRSSLITAVITACIALLFVIAFPREGSYISNTILVHPKPYGDLILTLTGIFLVLAISSLIAFFVIKHYFPDKGKLNHSSIITTSILFVSFGIVALAFIRIGSNSFWMKQSFDQKSIFDNRVYHLISYSAFVYTGDVDLRVFECGAQDIICRQLYQIKMPWYDPKSREVNASKKSLVIDPVTHTVTLQINGEAVYVYQVK